MTLLEKIRTDYEKKLEAEWTSSGTKKMTLDDLNKYHDHALNMRLMEHGLRPIPLERSPKSIIL